MIDLLDWLGGVAGIDARRGHAAGCDLAHAAGAHPGFVAAGVLENVLAVFEPGFAAGRDRIAAGQGDGVTARRTTGQQNGDQQGRPES